jgi:signal transduction histidine kinase/DNA-binding NarL/FixJ family response regulator
MKQEGPGSIADDIKEINKRGREIIVICIVVGLVLSPIDYFKGLIYSTCVVLGFTLSMIILFFLSQKFEFRKIRIPTFLLVCLVLLLGTYNEGLATGNFFYYFPMIIIIPSVIEDQARSTFHHITLFLIAGIGAVSCLYIGMNYIPSELISKAISSQLYYTNFLAAFVITLLFAYLHIKFERRYLEAINRQKNHSIAARTKFLSIMGHELRTPLNGIIGASNILKSGETLAEQKDYLEILSYCSDHMLLLVNDILDFNKIEAGKLDIRPIPLNLRDMLMKSILPFHNLFESKNLEFILEIDELLDIQVLADDVRIIQIMNNLFSNAIKFTEKGSIRFEVYCKSIGEDHVEVYFSVQDTGLGIDAKHQKMIFESFWQVYDESSRNFTGTGLGLAICRRLLELMESSLKVESVKGEGSRFYFTLKLPKSIQSINQSPFILGNQKLEGIRILLVEDNEINMLIAKKTLRDFHANIESAYNGEEAFALLENDSAFDLILMDLEMPVMNGYTVISPIRRSYPNIPVIAFTASLIDQEKLNYLLNLGFCDCILKPYQPNQLLEKIHKVLENLIMGLNLPATTGSPSARISSSKTAKSPASAAASKTTAGSTP